MDAHHEDIVRVRNLPALPKQLDQIIKLPMHVPGMMRAMANQQTEKGGAQKREGEHVRKSTHPQTVTGLCTGCTFDSSISISFTWKVEVGFVLRYHETRAARKYPITQQLELCL